MDTLDIGGARYVSARSAAKAYKYTSDYLGQLIRSGKLEGQKVGRSWYISEASLDAFLAKFTQKEQVPASVEETKVDEVHIPVRIDKAPTPSVEPVSHARHTPTEEYAFLKYMPDSEPTLPDLSVERDGSVVSDPAPAHEPEQTLSPEPTPVLASEVLKDEDYGGLITEDIPVRRRGERRELLPAPAALFAMIAFALLLTSGSTLLITEKLSYSEGSTSTRYVIEYKGTDVSQAVAAALVSIIPSRLSE